MQCRALQISVFLLATPLTEALAVSRQAQEVGPDGSSGDARGVSLLQRSIFSRVRSGVADALEELLGGGAAEGAPRGIIGEHQRASDGLDGAFVASGQDSLALATTGSLQHQNSTWNTWLNGAFDEWLRTGQKAAGSEEGLDAPETAVDSSQGEWVHQMAPGSVYNPPADRKSIATDVAADFRWQFVKDEPMNMSGGAQVLPLKMQKYPEGADIWNMSISWVNVTLRHPAGVISNVHNKKVVWADVSYLSLGMLYTASLVAYPVVAVLLILAATIIVGICMAQQDDADEREEDDVMPEGEEPMSVATAVAGLSDFGKRVFKYWSLFCRAIPAIMVFGMPTLLIGLTYPYPQEVFVLLLLVSSVMVFSNGIYMVFFGPFVLLQMKKAMAGAPRPFAHPEKKQEDEHEVVHWVIFPNYKEDFQVLREAIDSVGQSIIARNQICVLLAMEAREMQAEEKAARLISEFGPRFREVNFTLHPAHLPNDPPGKASNMAWAFKWLCKHLEEQEGADPARVVLTVADADSHFHKFYFDSLTTSFVETQMPKRHLTLWQSPIFHVKNYHRQPMPLIVGTMFTAMSEISVLSDPNSIRFPYSTYSLSMNLAKQVGGWDPEWIAEDWHMGIKCFLLTFGESSVEPILVPTVNYMPEETGSWVGTVYARWSQAKRHALGFSDMSYYFQMIPLIFATLSRPRRDKRDLRHFWKMFFLGLAYIIRLVNTHVIVGVMTLYMVFSFLLKNVMLFFLQNSRHVGELFSRSSGVCTMFFGASILTAITATLSFQVVYSSLKDRMEEVPHRWKKLYSYSFIHWLYTLLACTVFAALYCVGLGTAVWIAAFKVLVMTSFDYEVAAKPTMEHLPVKLA